MEPARIVLTRLCVLNIHLQVDFSAGLLLPPWSNGSGISRQELCCRATHFAHEGALEGFKDTVQDAFPPTGLLGWLNTAAARVELEGDVLGK